MKLRIAIFASGSGSNAQKLIQYFSNHSAIEIALIATNRKSAGVITHAQNADIESYTFGKEELKNGIVTSYLIKNKIDYILLAGFLALIPEDLVAAYPQKIMNIHPSLLPKYGGKGMYGEKVHEAVFANKETYSGLTIHLVNEEFDKGKVLFQCATNIDHCQSAEEIQAQVLCLEHRHFSKVAEAYLISK